MAKSPIHDALDALGRVVDRAVERGDTRLPGMRHLAESAGVSVTTMARAVAQFVDRGLLESVPRSGIRVAGTGRPRGNVSSAEPVRHRFDAVFARVKDDMLRGRHGVRRRFPTMKEFCYTYGVCRRTAGRILGALVDEGVLVVSGRTYVPAATVGPLRKSLKVVYVCRAYHGHDTVAPMGVQMTERLRVLETMLEQAGLGLEICYIRHVERFQVVDRNWAQVSPATAHQEGIAGFVVERAGADSVYPSLVRSLARLELPVVVLHGCPPDKRHVEELSPVGRRSRVLLIHYSADREMGRDVGRYALAMGHRTIAYFHAVGETGYSEERLRGMCAELADQGDARVHAVAGGRIVTPRPYARHILERAEKRIVGELHREPHTRELLSAAGLAGQGNVLTPSGSDIVELFLDVEPRLLEAVAQTLRRTDITLWVSANERLAFILSHVLRERGVQVPRDLSLLSIDANQQTMLQRITSYSMAVEETISIAVNALTRSGTVWGRRGRGLRQFATTGRIVERGSVRLLSTPFEA